MKIVAIALAGALTACAGPTPSASGVAGEWSPPDPSAAPSSTAPGSAAASATTRAAPAALEGLVAYVAGDDPQIHLLDLSTGESRQLTDLRPSHAEVVSAGPMRPALSCFFGPSGLTWSPDGSLLAFSYGGCEGVVYLVDLDGTLRRVGDGSGPSWSPDGRWLAFGPNVPYSPCGVGCLDPALGPWEILVVDVTSGEEARQLTTNGGAFTASRPIFAPDGSVVAFNGPHPEPDPAAGAFAAVYVVGADGKGQRIVARGAYVSGWIRDNRLLVAEEGSGRVHAIDLESAETVPIGGDQAFGFEVSPDGSRLLSLASDPVSDAQTVILSEIDGGGILAEHAGTAARWAADSSLFVLADRDLSRIMLVDRNGSTMATYPVDLVLGELSVRPGPVPGS